MSSELAYRTIPLTKGMVATVDLEDYERVICLKWCAHSSRHGAWYAWNCRHNLSMHRFILGLAKFKPLVDHKDHNGLNNRRSNLRIVTPAQNQWNVRIRGNKTGFKGVTRRAGRTGDRFIAKIKTQGHLRYIGSFITPEEAARAYDQAALNLFGEFACPNFPPELL